MNIKKSLPELEAYFKENTPETINDVTKRAAILLATSCAHPNSLETEDMEKITLPLQFLSEIVDIIDRYGHENIRDHND